ncbi:Hypothetical_protein [Hexamita inflata]|uniref:Hypothetical_protein n=1 Tax=Hexamita inflata TaxID=28002 RepID=A0AA86QXJ9_9EUKA|nr:Hypothetical protein HINF_LOCUS13664 [Hexamita inflata]CAI9962612.1 Hypothetical protein HINF_LOCUS50257 [Hexamita inflata]
MSYKHQNKKNNQKPAQKQVEKNQNQQTPITQPAQADQMQVTVTVDRKQYALGNEKTDAVLFTEKKTDAKIPSVITMTINHSETSVQPQQVVQALKTPVVKKLEKKNLAFSYADTENIQTKKVKPEPIDFKPQPSLSEWQNNMFASITKILKPSTNALTSNLNSTARIFANHETVDSNVPNEDQTLKTSMITSAWRETTSKTISSTSALKITSKNKELTKYQRSNNLSTSLPKVFR